MRILRRNARSKIYAMAMGLTAVAASYGDSVNESQAPRGALARGLLPKRSVLSPRSSTSSPRKGLWFAWRERKDALSPTGPWGPRESES